MEKKLYVGNLSYKVDEETLRELFAKVGEVQSVKIITDALTGRSRGFGFVEMASEEDAAKAISTLNGTNLIDRALTVNEARPQAERGRGGPRKGPGGGYGGGRRGPGDWR
jgi:RNA recognition motif-containing protein